MLLVPSGKVMTDLPSRMIRAASPMLRMALTKFLRSMGIYPPFFIASPKTGMLNSSFLAIQAK